MVYMPMIATDNCNSIPPVTNVYNIYNNSADIPSDNTTGCTPLGWCGTATEWIRLNKRMQARYDNITFRDDLHNTYPKEEIHHPIKISDCPKCASNLPLRKTDGKGICKCEFCGKEVYVW